MADIKAAKKRDSRVRRHRRVRARVQGTAERPRLCVFRSLKHIYGQVIDDEAGKTLAAVGIKDVKKPGKEAGDRKGKTAEAFMLGKALGEKAKAAGVTSVIFDRGGFAYKGRVAAFADGAREGGLEF